VRIFVMGENRWREEEDWPLPDTQYRPYYLHSGGHANSAAGDGVLSTTRADAESDGFKESREMTGRRTSRSPFSTNVFSKRISLLTRRFSSQRRQNSSYPVLKSRMIGSHAQ